ncbi:MAG: glucan biosynthesis protein G [Litoreibacter sp.]
MSFSRRDFMMMMGAAALASPAGALPRFKGDAVPFSREWLRGEAKRLSEIEYTPMAEVPQEWRDLSYDEYRSIWFNSNKSLWSDSDLPVKVDLFHPGLYFPRAVEINIIEGDTARPLAFDISLFDKTDAFPDLPVDENMGYSGFRLRSDLTKKGNFEEFLVFQGASYFRAIGTGQNYGLSARGLALNTGDAAGEEFPEFTNFWIEQPEKEAQDVVVHALLNSPSITGAYSFRIRHGLPAKIDVEATLYPRSTLDHVGLAPLTSMFLFNETNRARFDDFRSAVHDSEGLLVWNGAGELLWRPLANPKTLQISSFVDDGPQGFGLMQRERDLDDFGDLEAHYHNRPSLWITPVGDWGKGAVTLVEIPSEKEIYDNIVTYWRPREPFAAGSEHRFAYQMAWGEEPGQIRKLASVLKSRIGKGYDKEVPYSIMTVDFAPHPAFEDDLDDITKFISSSRGGVSDGVLQKNPATGGVRLAFKFEPGEQTGAEFRVQLVKDGVSLTEVWLYRWTA